MNIIQIINALVLVNIFIFCIIYICRVIIICRQLPNYFTPRFISFFKLLLKSWLFLIFILLGIFIILNKLNIPIPNIIIKNLININLFKYIGILYCYIFTIIYIFILISFGKNYRAIENDDPYKFTEEVMIKIIYQTQHPMFYINLYIIGIMLIYTNMPTIIITLCIIIEAIMKIIIEEKYFKYSFGEMYIQYKKSKNKKV
jgi:protein-S-isoprenylcysteine O-methyltransferase Ste14